MFTDPLGLSAGAGAFPGAGPVPSPAAHPVFQPGTAGNDAFVSSTTQILNAVSDAMHNAVDAVKAMCKDDDDECEKEWREARRTCRELIYEQMEQAAGRRKKRKVTGVTGGYTDVEECARGLVSKRCGGNELR